VLGDFRSCQILWALRLLGAIGEAPLEQTIDAALGDMDTRPVESSAPEPEPVAVAPSPTEDAPFEVVNGNELPDGFAPVEPDGPALTVSEEEEGAEFIQEPWRLAADRPRAVDAEAPRFEMAEPGTGIEDMNVDMPPAPTRAFEVGEPIPEAEPEAPVAETPLPALEIQAEPELDSEPEPEPEPEPVASALPELDQTTRISPEDIEAALGGPPAPPPEPAWAPPAELDGAIASFNARHAVLFRALRAEVGAGAANFVRSCRGSLGNGFGSIFASVELRADGSWDPDGLRKAVQDLRVEDPATGFTLLLEQEVGLLRVHLGDKRVSTLVEQLASIN